MPSPAMAPAALAWIQIHRRLGGRGALVDEIASPQQVSFADEVTRSVRDRTRERAAVVILEDVHATDAACSTWC